MGRPLRGPAAVSRLRSCSSPPLFPYNSPVPIFEYLCRDCDHRFETLVQGAAKPKCPSCEGERLEKQLSVFAVSTRATRPTPAPSPCASCDTPCGCGMN